MAKKLRIVAAAIIIYFATGAFLSIALPEIYTSLPEWLIRLISYIYEPVFVMMLGSF